MKISIDIDSRLLRDKLGKLSDKGLAYAAVNAINNVAKLTQKVEREELHNNFEIRTSKTSTFLERQVAIIKPFANVKQGRPYAEIAVGERPRLLLSTFELGGVKVPASGIGKNVAVPITGSAARANIHSPVARTMFLRALRIKARKAKTGTVQLKGVQRTFLLKRTAKAKTGGIYQRVGPKRDDIRMVYSFRAKPRLKSSLRFVQTAERVGFVWLQREMSDQLVREIERANRRAA